MSLKHALLGFINYGPMTGYELKKFFDTTVAHFWNAELSQIYPALKAMESEGLVEMKVEVQEDRPNRKVYSITEAGRREIVKWLAEPAEPDQVREPMLIKVFFGASVSKQDLINVLQLEAARHREYQKELEIAVTWCSRFAEAVGLGKQAPFWQLTIDAGLRVCRAEMEWAESAIQTLEALDDTAFSFDPGEWEAMDVRNAADILDRLKASLPGLSAASMAEKMKEPVG
jgi:PadR family transcriptional regulator, regulatory protein AphA